ncbi:hypothetical protein H632_c611p1 [Helicosporidium sp. ATCC 50920]|nr:hypothetical protein H632_c611p1 [Helicosporidium sp. ATCC 50920]|eukprot:KDD75575.1 hypothetical protein H632_c611p1 [Helicosporidium sp. ATCC 50920]
MAFVARKMPVGVFHGCLRGNVGEEDAEGGTEGETYQLEMMRCLRETNADNNTVGWYQSCVGGSFQVVEIIETFINYMENLERCICVVYDTAAAESGSLGLRALRLSDAFVAAFREGPLTIERVRAANLSWQSIFVEIPISVHNSSLAVALMASIASPSALTQLDCDRLGLALAPALERDLDCLADCVDDVLGEQAKLAGHHAALRRQQAAAAQWRLQQRQENAARRAAGEEPLPEEPPEGMFKPPAEPLQLDALLLANQMTTYCDHLATTATQAMQKVALVEALQKAR